MWKEKREEEREREEFCKKEAQRTEEIKNYVQQIRKEEEKNQRPLIEEVKKRLAEGDMKSLIGFEISDNQGKKLQLQFGTKEGEMFLDQLIDEGKTKRIIYSCIFRRIGLKIEAELSKIGEIII